MGDVEPAPVSVGAGEGVGGTGIVGSAEGSAPGGQSTVPGTQPIAIGTSAKSNTSAHPFSRRS